MVTTLSARYTRVLLGVLAVYEDEGRATVRSVCEAAGYRSTGSVHPVLVGLADLGLIAWTPGTRGTLRPLVTLLPACAA